MPQSQGPHVGFFCAVSRLVHHEQRQGSSVLVELKLSRFFDLTRSIKSMTACMSQLRLGFHPTLPVTVAFDAPQISSDGGVLLLRQTDDRLELSQWFADLLPEARELTKVEHDRREQVRQRLYQ